MVMRLIGLSVGLSGLTAWGLYRFNQLRGQIDLPSLSDPNYGKLAAEASADLTTRAMAQTFVAAGFVLIVAWLVATMMRRAPHHMSPESPPAATDQAEGAPMKPNRNLTPIIIAGGVLLAVLVVTTLFLVARVGSLSSELNETRAQQEQLTTDMSRVEGGAAIYAAQVTAFQDKLGQLGPAIDSALGDAVSGIDEFANSTITFDVSINQTVPIDTEIVLDRTLQVPINTTVPIDEQFDTTITVNGPFGIDIPLNITVPIKLDLPIDLTVAIPVNETIPINTEVPVDLDVPISIDISQTELATLAESLSQGLESFRQMAAGLAAG
jgi:outer membrane murein-binding lipoprotein Lpp